MGRELTQSIRVATLRRIGGKGQLVSLTFVGTATWCRWESPQIERIGCQADQIAPHCSKQGGDRTQIKPRPPTPATPRSPQCLSISSATHRLPSPSCLPIPDSRPPVSPAPMISTISCIKRLRHTTFCSNVSPSIPSPAHGSLVFIGISSAAMSGTQTNSSATD